MPRNCKRFITFGGDETNERVGWDAYQGSFESYANAEFHLKGRMESFKGESPWGQIVDTELGTITRLSLKETV